MRFTERLIDRIEYKGKTYRLNPAFDRVLRAFEILDDDSIHPAMKTDIALGILIKGKYPVDTVLLNRIFEALECLPRSNDDENKPRSMDFAFDAPYIYAAFLQTYGIDLYKVRGKLHFSAFMALLGSIPSDTRMTEIIKIRQMDIPKATKYNGEEIASIIKAKNLYRLPLTKEEKEKNLQNGFRTLLGTLLSMKGDEK